MRQQLGNCQENTVSPATIGRKIRRVRQLRGWTQSELAQAAGCCQSLVSDCERGYYEATKQWLPVFLTLLDLPTPPIEDTPPFELAARFIPGCGRCRACGATLFASAAEVPETWITEWHTAAPAGNTCLEHAGPQWASYRIGQ